jgi:hypothetical protein
MTDKRLMDTHFHGNDGTLVSYSAFQALKTGLFL